MNEATALKILCVDDEKEILHALRRVFRGVQYQTVLENDPKQAISLIKSENWDVIISDMRMPEIDGAQVLSIAASVQPNTTRILLSGFSDAEALSRAVNDGRINSFVNKPWNNQKLKELVESEYKKSNLQNQKAQIEKELEQMSEQLKEREAEFEQQLSLQNIELVNAGYVIELAEGRLESAFKNTYRMLSQLAHKRTGRSKEFASSMVRHCLILAKKVGVHKSLAKPLGMAASLSELGKITFPDSLISTKEQDIPAELWQRYSNYPAMAADLLLPISGMEPVSKILKQYREHIDGSGFPNGINEYEMSVESKILGVVYFYHSVTDQNQELGRLSHDRACIELQARIGTQFDKTIVNAYIEVIPEINKLKQAADSCCGTFKLKSGDIISRDLLSSTGILLLSKGTELSSALIDRLKIFEHQHNETLAVNIWARGNEITPEEKA